MAEELKANSAGLGYSAGSSDSQVTVEQVIKSQQDMKKAPIAWLICYQDRPLQVLPPGEDQDPFLAIFSTKDNAEGFTVDREGRFGAEPLFIMEIKDGAALRSLALAESDDDRYVGPPCGLLLDFSYKDQQYKEKLAAERFPQVSISGLEDWILLGDKALELIDNEKEEAPSDTAGYPRAPSELPSETEKGKSLTALSINKPMTRRKEEKESGSSWVGDLLNNRTYLYILISGLTILLLLVGSTTGILIFKSIMDSLEDQPSASQSGNEPLTLSEQGFSLPFIADFENPTLSIGDFRSSGAVGFNYSTGPAIEESYNIILQDTSTYAAVYFPFTLRNSEVRVSARMPEVWSTDAGFGILCRGTEQSAGIGYQITGDGRYRAISMNAEGSMLLSEWGQSDLINPSPERNELVLSCKDDLVSFLVNGENVSSTRDQTGISGRVGIIGWSQTEAPILVRFYDIQVSDVASQ